MGGESPRRFCFWFLLIVPFVVMAAVGIRDFRVPPVYQLTGVALFGAMMGSVWVLGGKAILSRNHEVHRTALVGWLLVSPFALVALLWIGLGTPWDATPVENRMRYSVLLTSSILVTGAFVILKDLLWETGERVFSSLLLLSSLLGGSAYLVWNCFQLGAFSITVAKGAMPSAFIEMSGIFDILLFIGSTLTYMAAATATISLRRCGWMGRGVAQGYLVASMVLLVFLVLRGLSFPDPTASSTPWYVRPGFIAGIPAVPWVVPYLIGVQLLRRSGVESSRSS